MSNEWYYQVMGEIRGPIPSQLLRERASSGQVERDTLVRKGESGEWVTADSVEGLFGPDDQPASAQVVKSRHSQPTNKPKRNPGLTKCPDCDGMISKRAKLCPHCGWEPEQSLYRRVINPIVIILTFLIGAAMVFFFAFLYVTAPDNFYNIGRLNTRLCGILVGLAFCAWGAMMSKE